MCPTSVQRTSCPVKGRPGATHAAAYAGAVPHCCGADMGDTTTEDCSAGPRPTAQQPAMLVQRGYTARQALQGMATQDAGRDGQVAANLEGALVLAHLEQLHDAALVRREARHLAHDCSHLRSALRVSTRRTRQRPRRPSPDCEHGDAAAGCAAALCTWLGAAKRGRQAAPQSAPPAA